MSYRQPQNMKRKTQATGHRPQLILALDVDGFGRAKAAVDLLYPTINIFKVGLQLFLAAGTQIVTYIKDSGALVFLDLKFYDIPNTVAFASQEAVRMGADMFTVHAQGGRDMLLAAKDAAQDEAERLQRKPPLILGITVLTSIDGTGNIKRRVLCLAQEARLAGLDGVVCSSHEAESIRRTIGSEFIIVTAGIRLQRKIKDDQKRIATVQEAVRAGSNYLVIGRPILKAKNPLRVIKKILTDISPDNMGR